MKVRLFTAGKHNGLTFSNDDIIAIHAATVGVGKVPFVIGHPKNDLPIVGWLPKSKIEVYKEGEKLSIGFERIDAEFSAESIATLKKLKRDKISVRLTEGAITHIGLVEVAAVAENNFQTFSVEEKSGVICFGDEMFFDEADDAEPKWFQKFMDKFFSNNKTTVMTEKEKQLQAELDAAKAKIADFESKQKSENEKAELNALKAKIADFENKEKNTTKEELKNKVDAMKLSADDAKAKMDFGNSLIDSNIDLAKQWIAGLQPAKVAATVKPGSVTDDEGTEDFAANGGKPKDVRKAGEAAVRKQFEAIKTANQ